MPGEDPSHSGNICIRRTRGKQRRRARYRLFPGAPVSDLAGDVNVGIQEESGQTTTTTTRGLVSNLRRIYPRKASRRLLPALSTCGERSTHSPPGDNPFRQTAAGKSLEQPPFITGVCSTRTFYCERLGGIRLIPRNTCDFIIHKYLR